MTREEHDRLQRAKRDLSWQRYEDGWPDIVDRYDVTAALVRGPDVLDVGCGQCLLGHLLRQHRPDVERYVGLDSWDEMLNEAKERGDFELWLGDAEELPFQEGEFDSVILGQVLEHVYDANDATMEALRVLRAGGRLIVNVPADDAEPHGNHVRVFKSVYEMQAPFRAFVQWQGEGRLHRYWFAWGEKCG
jgi:ubiquinone/menaquinone biosynthesis C-methylase UbiE